MNQDEIKKIIPHRKPMLLVDRVECGEDKNICYGFYTVQGDEYFLQGHFPGNPVVPGVMLCEMMAQSCCGIIQEPDTTPYFTSLNNVKFKSVVKPGDTVKFECNLKRKNGIFYFVSGQGYVDNKLCLTAELSFAAIKNEEK